MPALGNGGVQLVRDEVREFDGRDLVLGSGRRLENLDVVFTATGYQVRYYLYQVHNAVDEESDVPGGN